MNLTNTSFVCVGFFNWSGTLTEYFHSQVNFQCSSQHFLRQLWLLVFGCVFWVASFSASKNMLPVKLLEYLREGLQICFSRGDLQQAKGCASLRLREQPRDFAVDRIMFRSQPFPSNNLRFFWIRCYSVDLHFCFTGISRNRVFSMEKLLRTVNYWKMGLKMDLVTMLFYPWHPNRFWCQGKTILIVSLSRC